MATFVIETFLSRARAAELDDATARLRDAIAESVTAGSAGTAEPAATAESAPTIAPAASGPPARWLRSWFVPEDEVCYHVLEADSSETALEIGRRAGLRPDRVVAVEQASGSPSQ